MAAPARAATVQEQIEEITRDVEQIRGLTAKNPISFDFLNRDQLREKLIADFERDWPADERIRTQELMVMLGWLDPGQDLYTIEINILTEQIAGFYDPKDKKLYLITDQTQLSGSDKVAMAHEITHALQDQYFNLDQPPFDVEDGHEDDSESAALALVEGDAMRVSNEYQMKYLTPGELLDMGLDGSTAQYDAAPMYIQDSLLFPYIQGLNFVNRKAGASNAKADDLFRNVPDSTEQIMHPSRYPGQQPEQVSLPDLTGALGPDWLKDEYNVLGEFDVDEFFKQFLGDSVAEDASDGWAGNLYEYWKRGNDKLLIQSYAWDSADDAGEFARTFEDYMPARFSGASSREQDGWLRWEAGGYSFGLRLTGTRTDVVQSTDGTATQDAIAALGPGETIPSDGTRSGGTTGTANEPGISWLVIGAIAALALLAAALIISMLIIKRNQS